MPTEQDKPYQPILVCEGRGISPIDNYLCADICDRRVVWALRPSSRYFFNDGVVSVSAGGKPTVHLATCRSFQDFFAILYDDLPRPFGPGEIWRLLGHAQLLTHQKITSGNTVAEESAVGSSKSQDAAHGYDQRPSIIGSHEPLKPQNGDTFPQIFGGLYSKRREEFDAVDVMKMNVEAERLLHVFSLPVVENVNDVIEGTDQQTSGKRAQKTARDGYAKRSKPNTRERLRHVPWPQVSRGPDYGRLPSFSSMTVPRQGKTRFSHSLQLRR